jgi:hypothetical protein
MELAKIVALFICAYILSVIGDGFPDKFPIGELSISFQNHLVFYCFVVIFFTCPVFSFSKS